MPRMDNARICLVGPPQHEVMLWVFVESLEAKWTTKRDHSRASLNVGKTTPMIDGFAADNAKVIPILYVCIFKFTHLFVILSNSCVAVKKV